ncbi:MAG: InlB B-repeat-containing protein, partial [Clostridiales bacterium]
MKKPKKRLLWLGITAIMVLMFAMSASAMAANESNVFTVWYLDSDGTVIDTQYADLQQGRDTSFPYKYTYRIDFNINQENPNKPGYTFDGWKTDWEKFPDTYQKSANMVVLNTGYIYRSEQTFEDLHDEKEIDNDQIILTAQYTANQHTLTFVDYNYNTSTGSTTTNAVNYDQVFTLPTPAAQDGYIFVGWINQADNKVYIDTVTVKGDATYNAKWIKNNDHQKVVKFIDPDSGVFYDYIEAPLGTANVKAPGLIKPPTKPGYKFTGWSATKDSPATLVAGANLPFTTADPTIYYAVFEANDIALSKFGTNVDIYSGNSGTNALNATYPAGSTVEFYVAPRADFAVESVRVETTAGIIPIKPVQGNANAYTFIMPTSGATIYANGVENTFNITQGTVENVDIVIQNAQPMAKTISSPTYRTVGDIVTFTATPTEGYILKGAPTVNMGSTLIPITQGNNAYTFQFTMPKGDVSISAKAIKSDYNIAFEANSDLDFTLTKPATGEVAAAGSAVNFKLEAVSDRNIVEDVKIMGASSGKAIPSQNVNGTWTFSMPEENVMISAKAVQNVFDVDTIPDANTRILFQGPVNTITAAAGEAVPFIAMSTDPDYELKEIKIFDSNGKAVNFEKIELQSSPQQVYGYMFEMPKADVLITATATQVVFPVITDITTNAAVTVTSLPNTKAKVGSAVNFTVAPNDANYIVKDNDVKVTFKGANVPISKNGDTFSFTMPNGEVTISAMATKNVYSVATNAGANTTLTLDPAITTATVGSDVTFTATAAANYSIKDINVNKTGGGVIKPEYVSEADGVFTYKFQMPAADVTITSAASAADYSLVILDRTGHLRAIENVKFQSTFDVLAKYAIPDVDGYTSEGKYIDKDSGKEFTDRTQIIGNTVVIPVYKPTAQNITAATQSQTVNKHLETLNVDTYNKDGNKTTRNFVGNLESTLISSTDASSKISVKAAPHYKIVSVSLRPTTALSDTYIPVREISEDATGLFTYGFTMPAENVEVLVKTEPLPYDVTVDKKATLDEGRYTLNGTEAKTISVKQGSPVTLDVTPTPGYKISRIVASYTPDTGGTAYVIDKVAKKALNSVQNEDLLDKTTFTFDMPQNNVSIELEYKLIDYIIDTEDTNAANAKPAQQYENGTVVASIPARTISGTTTTNIANANVKDVVTLDVTPATGYDFKDLTVTLRNGKAIALKTITDGAKYQFEMPAGYVIVNATFVKEKYTVTFIDGNESNNVQIGTTQSVAYMENPTAAPTPPSHVGYDFQGWVSADSIPAVTTATTNMNAFNIDKDTVITTVYTQRNYDIAYSIGSNGNVTGENNGNFESTQTFKVTPELGYQIDKVTASYVNSHGTVTPFNFTTVPTDLVAGGDYIYTMPAGAVTIKATFKPIIHTVTLASVNNGTTLLNGKAQETDNVAFAKEVKVKATPENPGWKLDAITVVGASGNVTLDPATVNPAGGIYTFIMPNENVTVTVTYVQRDFAIGYYDGNTSPKEKATIANSSAKLTHGRIYNLNETGQY